MGDHFQMMKFDTCGERVRYIRELRGWFNQGEFARLVGLKQGALSELESGKTRFPSAPVALKMCELTGVSLRWLLFGEDGEITIPTKDEASFLDALRSMSPEQREAVLKVVSSMTAPGKT